MKQFIDFNRTYNALTLKIIESTSILKIQGPLKGGPKIKLYFLMEILMLLVTKPSWFA